MKDSDPNDNAPVYFTVIALFVLFMAVGVFSAMGRAQTQRQSVMRAFFDKVFTPKSKTKAEKENDQIKDSYTQCSKSAQDCQRMCKAYPAGSSENMNCVSDCYSRQDSCMGQGR